MIILNLIMNSMLSLFPKTSFLSTIFKDTHNSPLDLHFIYRQSRKNKVYSYIYNHNKNGYLFNNSLVSFDGSIKLMTIYNKDYIVISEKLKSNVDEQYLNNNYFIKLSNITTGEIIAEDYFTYKYNLNTKFVHNDLRNLHQRQTLEYLEYISKGS